MIHGGRRGVGKSLAGGQCLELYPKLASLEEVHEWAVRGGVLDWLALAIVRSHKTFEGMVQLFSRSRNHS